MSAKRGTRQAAPNILLEVMAPITLVERSLDRLGECQPLNSEGSLLVEGMCLTLRRALADLQRAHNYQDSLEIVAKRGALS